MPQRIGAYDPKPFRALLSRALDDSQQDLKAVAHAIGIPAARINYWAEGKLSPTQLSCLRLAEHLGIDPNDVLESAGYNRLSVLDADSDPASWNPDVSALAHELQEIPLLARRELLQALSAILDTCFARRGQRPGDSDRPEKE